MGFLILKWLTFGQQQKQTQTMLIMTKEKEQQKDGNAQKRNDKMATNNNKVLKKHIKTLGSA
jgi:protein-disulfide isomerase